MSLTLGICYIHHLLKLRFIYFIIKVKSGENLTMRDISTNHQNSGE